METIKLKNPIMENSKNSLDVTLEECKKISSMFMNCDFSDIRKVIDHNDDLMVNCMGQIALSLESLMTVDEEKCKKASKSMDKLLTQVNERRNKSWRAYFSRKYYDSLTDEEVHFELVYYEMQIFCALLASIADPSFSAFISAAFYVKSSNSGFYKCKKILEQRTTWTSESSKLSFEAGTLFGLSLFELMISFLPGKFIRLVELFGFCGNRDEALGNMKRVVVSGQSTARFPVIAILFVTYYSFLEYYFGLGHDFSEERDNIMRTVNLRFKDSPVADLLNGLAESSKGNLKIGNKFFSSALKDEKASFLKDICGHQMYWNHVFLCDWAGAVSDMRGLRQCKFSRAAFSFNEGTALKMLLEENNNKNFTESNENDTKEEVTRLIRQVRSLKKTFGGARAFHEQLVLLKSDQNHDNTNGLFLSPLDAGYIFNYFRLFVKNPDVAVNILKEIESRERNLNSSDELFKEKSALALFLKAVINRQMQEYDESMKMFQKVIEMEVNEHFSYLKANSHYELGLMHFEVTQDYETATYHLKKAKSVPNQISKQMIDHKVAIVMESIRRN